MKTETTPKAETESRTRIQAYSKSKPHSLKPDIVKKPSCSLRHK